MLQDYFLHTRCKIYKLCFTKGLDISEHSVSVYLQVIIQYGHIRHPLPLFPGAFPRIEVDEVF